MGCARILIEHAKEYLCQTPTCTQLSGFIRIVCTSTRECCPGLASCKMKNIFSGIQISSPLPSVISPRHRQQCNASSSMRLGGPRLRWRARPRASPRPCRFASWRHQANKRSSASTSTNTLATAPTVIIPARAADGHLGVLPRAPQPGPPHVSHGCSRATSWRSALWGPRERGGHESI